MDLFYLNEPFILYCYFWLADNKEWGLYTQHSIPIAMYKYHSKHYVSSLKRPLYSYIFAGIMCKISIVLLCQCSLTIGRFFHTWCTLINKNTHQTNVASVCRMSISAWRSFAILTMTRSLPSAVNWPGSKRHFVCGAKKWVKLLKLVWWSGGVDCCYRDLGILRMRAPGVKNRMPLSTRYSCLSIYFSAIFFYWCICAYVHAFFLGANLFPNLQYVIGHLLTNVCIHVHLA